MSAFKHTIVTIYYNLQTYLEYFQYTTVRENKFQEDKEVNMSPLKAMQFFPTTKPVVKILWRQKNPKAHTIVNANIINTVRRRDFSGPQNPI